MGILRRVDSAIYNDELLKGYDAIAFSFNKQTAKNIYENNLLSNIISKHIVEIKYNNLLPGQVIINNYNGHTRSMWNVHESHIGLVDKCINYMRVINACKRNEYQKVLLIINSDLYPSCIKMIEYLSIQNDIDIDVISLLCKNG